MKEANANMDKLFKGNVSPDKKLTKEEAADASERIATHSKMGAQAEDLIQSEVIKIENLITQYKKSFNDLEQLRGEDRSNASDKLVEEINTHLDRISHTDNEGVNRAKKELESLRESIGSK